MTPHTRGGGAESELTTLVYEDTTVQALRGGKKVSSETSGVEGTLKLNNHWKYANVRFGDHYTWLLQLA